MNKQNDIIVKRDGNIVNGHYLVVADNICARNKDLCTAIREAHSCADTGARFAVWFIPTDSCDYTIDKMDGTPRVDGAQFGAHDSFRKNHCLGSAIKRITKKMYAALCDNAIRINRVYC